MITSKGRKLLKIIIKACDNQCSTIDYQYLLDELTYGKMSESDIHIALSDLHYDKLIYFRITPEHDIPIDITLKYEGLRYFDWKWEKAKDFLLKNILVPSVVAFFTTLITIWIDSFK
ncbi:hypothetical protein [Enterococcus olivae]